MKRDLQGLFFLFVYKIILDIDCCFMYYEDWEICEKII